MQSFSSPRGFHSRCVKAAIAALGALLLPCVALAQVPDALPDNTTSTGGTYPLWFGFGREAQHAAPAPVASQPFTRIKWQTPVDLNPQYSGSELLIHYGSPMTTLYDKVIVPVKTGATDGFERSEERRV